MASKEAKKAGKNFLNSPFGVLLIIIAIIIALVKWVFKI